MLIIECPFCGPRTEDEFSYGGQAHVAYPEDPFALSDSEWAHFLFYRDNPRGSYAERWMHAAGCRKWFNAVRDTRTYEIQCVYKLTDEQPPILAGAPTSGTPTQAADPTHHSKED